MLSVAEGIRLAELDGAAITEELDESDELEELDEIDEMTEVVKVAELEELVGKGKVCSVVGMLKLNKDESVPLIEMVEATSIRVELPLVIVLTPDKPRFADAGMVRIKIPLRAVVNVGVMVSSTEGPKGASVT